MNAEKSCSFSSVAATITDEIFRVVVYQKDENNTTHKTSSGSKQNKMQRNTNSNTSKKKQPLFASVIQHWFLQERMRARGIEWGEWGSKKSKKKKKKTKKGSPQAAKDVGDEEGSDAKEGSEMTSLENYVTLSNTSPSAAAASSFGKLDCVLDRCIDLQKDGIDECEVNAVEGRDLHAFTTFLSDKFHHYVDEQQQPPQKTAEDNSGKSPTRYDTTDQMYCGMNFIELLPSILLSDVQNNAKKVECRCGHAMRSHLNAYFDKYQSVEQKIVLEAYTEDEDYDVLGFTNDDHGLSIPVCSNYLDDENCDPFGYGALIDDDDVDLEAGAQSSEQREEKIESSTSSLRLELRQIISSLDDTTRYLQINPMFTQNNDGKAKSVYPINEQSILNLVKCIIVPNGIGGSGVDIDCESDLDDKDLDFIKIRGESSENEFVHQFFDILQSSEAAKTLLMDAREEAARRSFFDPKTSMILRQVDGKLNRLLKQTAQYLIRITKYCLCVGWYSERPTPISIVTQLWNEFEKLLVDLVKPSLKVRGTIIQSKGRPGKTPVAFGNSTVRNALDQMVSLKIDKLDRLLYFLRTEFLRRPDCNANNFLKTNIPSPMLRICMLEAYSMRKHQLSADDMFSNEDCFNEMLDAKIELPQVSSHTTKNSVEIDEKERMERFRLAYKKVVEIVTKADAHLTSQSFPNVASLVSASEMYESKRLDYELEERNSSSGSTTFLTLDYDEDQGKSTLEEDTTRALNKSAALWIQWVYILCIENYSTSPNKIFHINRELKIHMDGEVKNPCEDGGDRKVSVIIATLLYRWLEAKFDEWHAELTREELLKEAMELTTPLAATKGGTSKTSKKKRSKRNKRGKEENNESSPTVNLIESKSGSDIHGHDARCTAEVVPTVEEPVAALVLNFDETGWTTVGENMKSNNDENNTACDEEIARALQEQFREEAKQYEVMNTETLSREDSNAENATSVTQGDNAPATKNNATSDEIVSATSTKSSVIAKAKKRSKSQNTKDVSSTSNDVRKDIAAKQTNEYHPKVGVCDGDAFVDAETYLVNRMKQVKKKLVWL